MLTQPFAGYRTQISIYYLGSQQPKGDNTLHFISHLDRGPRDARQEQLVSFFGQPKQEQLEDISLT